MNKMVFLIFTIMFVFLPIVIAKKEDVVCPSFDENCFLNRYGNLELPKVNSEKVRLASLFTMKHKGVNVLISTF